MLGALGTILLILSIVVGGGGVTVAAAQESLPNQALYSVKTWSEDFRTGFTNDQQSSLELALAFANRRAEEMKTMLAAGEVPPDAVLTRMAAEVDAALRLAAAQPDDQAVLALTQIREQLRTDQQAFTQVRTGSGSQADALLTRVRDMLQDRLRLCDAGLQDPALLRLQLRERDLLKDGSGVNPEDRPGGNPWTTGTPTSGSSYGPGPGDGEGGSNPWTTGTPTPGSSYGPGPGDGEGGGNPWTTGTPTPGSSYGPGPGDGEGGSNPWTTGTPTPGSSYGPGPGEGANDGSSTGSGQPGGTTDPGPGPDNGGGSPDNGGSGNGGGGSDGAGGGSGGNH